MVRKGKERMVKINILDLFSGIGGFALGVEQTGIKTGYVGFSDIDKYANKIYKRRFPNAKKLGSVTNVSYESLKGQKIDLLTGGFPCQAFSLAGKRRGFEDSRGTLFFEIARILKDYIENGKPISCILLENVKGLLSHDNKRTFITIYEVLTNLNYTLECEVVNTRWWLPQNRERIFIFGRYNGNPSGRKVFPVRPNNKKNKQRKIKSKIKTHSLYPRSSKTGKGGTGHLSKEDGISYCLDTGNTQGIQVKSKYLNKNQIEKFNKLKVDSSVSGTLTEAFGRGGSSAEYLKMLKKNKQITGHIRKLTPIECERLQGFPDNWTDGQSDTQRYKQLGNAVSVPVIKAIVEKIYDL